MSTHLRDTGHRIVVQRKGSAMVRRNGLAVAALGAVAAAATFGWTRREAIDQVDPQLRAPVLWLPFSLGSAAMLRPLAWLNEHTPDSAAPQGVSLERFTVDEHASVLVYLAEDRPRHADTGALLWIHGGGHILGTPGMDHELCARFARQLQVPIISVDYRLAPKDRFPADLDDCFSALQWVFEHCAQFGIDPELIAVGGASAGGGLAAGLAQRAYDNGLGIAAQLLVYPMLDDRTALRTDHARRGQLLWTPASNRTAWEAYLGHPIGQQPAQYASPARRVDLHGLPKTWIGVGELDLFLTEDLEYAERLREAGVDTELVTVPGMYHGADGTCPEAPITKAFHASMIDFLRPVLLPSAPPPTR